MGGPLGRRGHGLKRCPNYRSHFHKWACNVQGLGLNKGTGNELCKELTFVRGTSKRVVFSQQVGSGERLIICVTADSIS